MSTKISNRPVKYNYEMRPGIDELVRGDKLKNGMVVMLEDHIIRSFASKRPAAAGHDLTRFLETRYWCEVTEFVREDHDLVRFVGVYANGVKRARHFSESYYWIVRKDSIPQTYS